MAIITARRHRVVARGPGRRVNLGLVCACLVLLACATVVTMSSLPTEVRDRIQSRSFGVPDSVLYSAVLLTLVDHGYPIQVSDKTAGMIQTEPRMDEISEGQDFATLVLAGVKVRNRKRIAARVKDGSVKINITFENEMKNNYGRESGWEPVNLDTAYSRPVYDAVFAAIADRVVKESK